MRDEVPANRTVRPLRARMARALARFRQEPGTENLRRFEPIVRAICERRGELLGVSTDLLVAQFVDLSKADWRADRTLVEYCAMMSELLRRVKAIEPHPVQLLGAVAMLRGFAIDMATGEGKTLVGAIVAAGFATQGRGVHVLSANE